MVYRRKKTLRKKGGKRETKGRRNRTGRKIKGGSISFIFLAPLEANSENIFRANRFRYLLVRTIDKDRNNVMVISVKYENFGEFVEEELFNGDGSYKYDKTETEKQILKRFQAVIDAHEDNPRYDKIMFKIMTKEDFKQMMNKEKYSPLDTLYDNSNYLRPIRRKDINKNINIFNNFLATKRQQNEIE